MKFLSDNKDQDLKEIHQLLMEKIENLRNKSEASDDITILSLRFH